LPLRALWLICGIAALIGLTAGSLLTLPQLGPDVPGGDKLQHLLGYFVLTIWFAQLVASRRALLMHAASFILFGIAIEYAQMLTLTRRFEYADMLANTAGVLIGTGLGLTRARNGLAQTLAAVFRWR